MPPEVPESTQRERPSWAVWLRDLCFVLVGALVVSSVVRALVFQPFEVPSGSMENTLLIGDRIIAQRITAYHRGDVIVFKDSNHWLPPGGLPPRGSVGQVLEFVGVLPDRSQDFLTKRVVGVAGDRVACCDRQGRVTVNGYALDESAYLYQDHSGMVEPSEHPFDVVVPVDHLFVLGDHRNASGDSRCHLTDLALDGYRGGPAFVAADDVVGSVVLVWLPTSRTTLLRTPDTFAGVPPPAAAPEQPVIVGDGNAC